MRKRGGWADADERVAAQIHFAVTAGDHAVDLFVGHSFLKILEHMAVDIASGLAGQAHEFEFVWGFMGAASDGDGIGGDEIESGCVCAKVIEKSEGKCFVNADLAGAEMTIGEGSGDKLCGTFVFLPDTDIDGIAHEFANACFFEGGRNEDGLAVGRDDEGEKTLAESPTDAGEIVEGSARAEKDSVKFRLEIGHELLGVQQATVKFVGSDGMHAIAERRERRERSRE